MADLIAVRPGQALFSVGDDKGVIVDAAGLNADAPQPLQLLIASGGWTTPVSIPSNVKTMTALANASVISFAFGQSQRPALTSRTFRPPKMARTNAEKALKTVTGDAPDDAVAYAKALSTGSPLTVADVGRAIAYFNGSPEYIDSEESRLRGGKNGRSWVLSLATSIGASALSAAGAPVEPSWQETDWVNIDEPHAFVESADDDLCMLCQLPATDEIHVLAALPASGSKFAEVSSHEEVRDAVLYYATLPRGARASVKTEISQAAFANGLADALPRVWMFPRVTPPLDVAEFDVVTWSKSLDDGDYFTRVVDGLDYGDDGDIEEEAGPLQVEGLLHRAVGDGSWHRFNPGPKTWSPCDEPDDSAVVVIVDDDVASEIIEHILGGDTSGPMELAIDEAALYRAAESALDFEFLDSLIAAGEGVEVEDVGDDGYTPEERARNAARQGRDSTGRFAPRGIDGGEPQPDLPQVKARLEVALPLVEDPAKLIDDYLKFAAEKAKEKTTLAAAEADDAGAVTSPDRSPVDPLYLAIVDQNDPQAVLELVALVPAPVEGGQPSTWIRKAGKWEYSLNTLRDLKGSTPPPIVQLDAETYKLVVEQVDVATADESGVAASGSIFESIADGPAATPLWGPKGELLSLVAAGVPGIADTPQDERNAERLRRYWTVGPGGAKIRWNTPGDWTRCYRHLKKHMGVRAKGYCALRHKEMTGTWTGSRANIGNQGK